MHVHLLLLIHCAIQGYGSLKIRSNVWRLLDGFGGLVVSMLTSGTRVRGFKPGRFFGHLKNPPHAFLRRGSERMCVPALWHAKEPSTSVNYDVLAKFLV